jgi:hypothetical protein
MSIDQIESILASEIECSIFEDHVVPALNAARKVLADTPAIAWMVKGNFNDFFTDLEEAHKYAMTVRAKVIPLYAWGD